MKTLIVDDSSTMRKVVMRTLHQAGDGVESLAVLDSAQVDLVFSDVNMPNMGGLDFVKAIRGRDEGGNVPIVMATTEGGQDAMGEASFAGASGYVVKPLTADKLKSVLDEVLA